MTLSKAVPTLLLLLFVATIPGTAQLPTPAGPVLPVEGHPAAPYLDPDTFVSPGGDFVHLTWERRPEPSVFPPFHLMGQRFGSDGTPKGTAFEVDTEPGSPAYFFEGEPNGFQRGTFLTEETFAVAWASPREGIKDPELYLRFFDGNGIPRNSPLDISGGDFLETLSLQRLDDFRVVVLSTYDGNFPQTLQAFYGVVSSDRVGFATLSRVGKEVPGSYDCSGFFGEWVYGVELLPDGDFQVVFSRTGSDGPQASCQEFPSGVFLRQFSPRGDPRGPEMRIADNYPGTFRGKAKLVPGAGLLVLQFSFGEELFRGQWYTPEGLPKTPAFEVKSLLFEALPNLVIATPPTGELLVSWNQVTTRWPVATKRFTRALEVPCTPGPSTLCLEGGRFRAEVDWADFRDREGFGSAEPLSDETGYFTFFNPDNVELVVKVLDGEANNGNFWVFYGALSNVEYRLTVTDTEQSLQKVYRNPPRNFASVGDTEAFPAPLQAPAAGSRLSPQDLAELLPTLATDGPGLATAGESGTDLTFQSGRFRASVEWRDFQDRTGIGHGATLTDDTGYFWFFRPENVELVVKVLDGSANNGNYWVFYGALSNVEYTLTVEDTATSTTKSYFNPLRTFASEGDTEAFPE